MKNLYLVQHGRAKLKEEDPECPLNEVGHQETQLMAEMVAKLGLEIDTIQHSGKTRAEQTALILAEALSLSDSAKSASGLGPVDDIEPVAEFLEEQSQTFMLVGHLPFMPRLAGYLVNGNSEDSPVDFINSGILCLSHQGGDWQVSWHLTPR